ncbi:MAG: alpha/beta fold hydrolase [Mucilaginibacter sp.]|uniref:alpha/beta fold hydrolase n=1 Tax=Mucilaginibacter sp. TaxID=1882438 RepID=UPI003262E972
MIRSLTLCLALLLIATYTFAETEQPADKITIAKLIRYYNNNQSDSLYKIFDPIMQSALPADKVGVLFSQMKGQLGPLKQTTFAQYVGGAANYKGEFQNDALTIVLAVNSQKQISGLYFKPYQAPAAVTEKPAIADAKPVVTAAVDASITETELSLKTLAGTLSGTLSMPKEVSGKIPVVLIIAASGPVDRNGNSTQGLNGNTYKYIAEGLGKAGIACLRYDKRGSGKSVTSQKETDTKFTDYVDDASAMMLTLKDDKRFSKFIILGHSEGSLVGMITAYGEPINGLISVAGAGRPADQILIEQMGKTQPPAVVDEFKNIIDSLKKGKTTPRVDPSLYFIARPSLQNYLMTWIPYDPARVIKKIKTSFLIVQGTTDLQVSVGDAEKLKKAKSEAVLKIIDGMNHILKAAPADKEKNMATYGDPTLPLKPEFMTAVVDFIKGLK